jgi:hypothetical protein
MGKSIGRKQSPGESRDDKLNNQKPALKKNGFSFWPLDS